MKASSTNLLRLGAGLLVLAVLCCGKSGDDGSGPSGSFAISAPATITAEAGSSGAVQVTVVCSGGFSDAVTVTLEEHPDAISHDTPAASGGTGTVMLSFAIAATAAPGSYSIKACGSASGMTRQCTPVTLTVTPAPTGGFTLALNPASLSIMQGQSGTAAITVTRTVPFTGAVALQILIAPVGISRTFEPAVIPVGEQSSTLTIAVAGDAIPGVYPLVINGSATGVDPQDVQLVLTVTAMPGEFTLSVSPGSLAIELGKTGTVGVTVTRTPPWQGRVDLAVEGLPAGVLGTFNPAWLPAGMTAATLTLVATPPAATPGTYQLTVRATGSGAPEQTATVNLTLTEPAGFTLAGGSAGVQQGQVGAGGILVTRTGGFAGPVTLAIEGVPAGVNARLAPETIAAGETNGSIVYTVLATATVGQYQLMLHGTGPGVPEVSKPVVLEVRPAPAGNVTFTFCSTVETPIWFGYQNGTDQWTQVAGPGGVFNFPVTAATGGVAWVVPWENEPGFYIGMILGTQAELVELGSRWCQYTPPRKTLTGTVANVGTDWYNVSIGDASVEVQDGFPLTYQLGDVPAGLLDLVASKTTIPVASTSSTMIIRRGVNYPAGSGIPLLDFASGEAFTTTTRHVTVENLGGESYRFTEAYVTAGGTIGLFAHRSPKTDQTPYMVVPAAKAQAGDVYNVKIESSWQGGMFNRMVVQSFDVTNDQTVTLGSGLSAPSVFELHAAPLYQVRVVSTWQAEYGNVFNGTFFQDTRDGEFYVTRGYLGSGATLDVTTPDLRYVPGWNAIWGPVPGALTVLRGVAYGWTGGGGTLFPGFMGDFLTAPNVTMRSAAVATVTVP